MQEQDAVYEEAEALGQDGESQRYDLGRWQEAVNEECWQDRGRAPRSIQGKCSVRVFRVFRRSIQLGQKMNIFQKLTRIIFTKKYAEKMSKKS